METLSDNHIEIIDTKTKILAVANELFARQGFDGVSIRDIANAAEVNVASINYHFKNKINLFHSIFAYNFEWMEGEVKKIAAIDAINSEEATWKIFMKFKEHGTVMINAFNLILSDHLQPEEGLVCGTDRLGPPGEKALLEIVTKDVGEKVPLEDREWAVRMIFSNLFHLATIMNTSFFERKCANEEWITPERKEKDIKLLVSALLKQIKG